MSITNEGKPLRLVGSENPRTLPYFEMQDVVSDGRHRLVLTGELDLAPAAELEAMLLRLCSDGTKAIAIDLSKLRFMGSIGLRLILLARELCDEHGYEYRLIAGPANIQRVFEMTGLLDVLPFQPRDRGLASS